MTERSCDDRQWLLDNRARIEEELTNACIAAGRKREEVTLMAVTKTVEPERINVLLDDGITCIGENRVQEFLEKKEALHLSGVHCHLIGHLQTNKVKKIVGQVERIESVDSLRVGKAIADASLALGMTTDVLVEINIGNESSKSGIEASATEELVGKLAEFPGIRVRGLMAIPPICTTEREKRRFFSQMHKLFIDIRDKKVDNVSMDVLSMGMSDDYVPAVLEGSTQVRIGSALFGKRVYNKI